MKHTHLTYGKVEVDGRCIDLLLTDTEVARGAKRACDHENFDLMPTDLNTCWPIEKPPECSFWNRITGNCKS
jgi:hypothetical protein